MSEEVNDKIVGVLSYLTLIGFIIGIILNNDKKGEEKAFGAFHLRQSLGLIIVSIGFYIAYAIVATILLAIGAVFSFLVSLIYITLVLALFALIIIGIINAVNGEKKELPIIGSYASKMLKNTFE